MKFRYLLFLLVLMLGCVEIIDFSTEDNVKLTIYGRLNDSGTSLPKVYIQYSELETSEIQSVNNAIVKVVDSFQNENYFRFVNTSESDGYYEAFSHFGRPGERYQLQIQIGSSYYESTWQQIPTINANFEAEYNIQTEQYISVDGYPFDGLSSVIKLNVELPDTPEELYLMWQTTETWPIRQSFRTLGGFSTRNCYLYRDYFHSYVPMFTTEGNEAKSIRDYEIVRHQIDNTFRLIHHYGIVQYSMTKDGYEYWQQVDQVINREGTLFETPPAKVLGNIASVNNPDEQILGFFEVAKVDTAVVTITKSDFIGTTIQFVSRNSRFEEENCTAEVPPFIRQEEND